MVLDKVNDVPCLFIPDCSTYRNFRSLSTADNILTDISSYLPRCSVHLRLAHKHYYQLIAFIIALERYYVTCSTWIIELYQQDAAQRYELQKIIVKRWFHTYLSMLKKRDS